MPRLPLRRRGMTLVELLVVVGIILVMFVAVAPNFVNTVEARRSREAARMLSSFVAKAQSRALGNPEWSGFTVLASTTTSFAAVDLALADVPPVYRGDTVPALLTITGSVSAAVWRATGTQSQLTASGAAIVAECDLIRFDGRGPWYEVHESGTTFIDFRIRGDLTGGAPTPGNLSKEMSSMSKHNTPWPPQGARLPFEVVRQPVAAGSPLALPEGRAIDLAWSGYGPPQANSLAAYQRFTAGSRVSALFDGTGRLRRIFEVAPTATTRRVVTGPLFFLVGRVDRAGGDPATFDASDDTTGANWQYPDSWWVAIDPMTGAVRSAECTPNPSGATYDEKLIGSQAWIRQALLGTGR